MDGPPQPPLPRLQQQHQYGGPGHAAANAASASVGGGAAVSPVSGWKGAATMGPPKALQAGATHQQAFPFEPSTQPRDFLLAVFEQVVHTDKEGYFLRPVDERVAPGYYKTILTPLCFAEMREKLQTDQYASYKALMADFELIVNNARTFNTPKTRCHKCAVQLQRNVNKIMSNYELGVRKAFAVLHPALTAAAAPGSTQQQQTSAAGRTVETSDVTSTGAGTSSAQRHDDASGGTGDVVATPLHVKAEPGAAAATNNGALGLPPGSLQQQQQQRGKRTGSMLPPPLPPAPPLTNQPLTALLPLEPLARAYSANQDELLLVAEHLQRPPAAAGGMGAVPAQVASQHKPGITLEALMSELRQGAVFELWPGAEAQQHGEQLAQQQQGAVDAPALLPLPGRTPEWKAARRSIEWQCHWLQLRMHELQAQMSLLRGALADPHQPAAAAQQQQQGVGQPAAAGGSSASSSLVAAELRLRKRALTAASARHLRGGPEPPASPRPPPPPPSAAGTPYKAAPAAAPAPVPWALLPLRATPFFAGVQPPPPHTQPPQPQGQHQVQLQAGGNGEMSDAAALAAVMPPPASTQWLLGSAVPDNQLPAAVFAGLEALELQLLDVKRGLHQAFNLDQRGRIRPGAARSTAPAAPAVAVLTPAASSAVAAAAPAAASLLLRRQPSATAVARYGSSGSLGLHRSGSLALGGGPQGNLQGGRTGSLLAEGTGKRRRGAAGVAGSEEGGDGRALDRAISILTPPVRELSELELRARQEASGAWSESYRALGLLALEVLPAAVAAVLQQSQLEGEGSSSEETGDEAYEYLHAIMAEEERRRFAAIAAEGQRRRTKQSKHSNGTPSVATNTVAGGSAAAAVAGLPGTSSRRLSTSIKTPRATTSSAALAQPLSPHAAATSQPQLPPAHGSFGDAAGAPGDHAYPYAPDRSPPTGGAAGPGRLAYAPLLLPPPANPRAALLLVPPAAPAPPPPAVALAPPLLAWLPPAVVGSGRQLSSRVLAALHPEHPLLAAAAPVAGLPAAVGGGGRGAAVAAAAAGGARAVPRWGAGGPGRVALMGPRLAPQPPAPGGVYHGPQALLAGSAAVPMLLPASRRPPRRAAAAAAAALHAALDAAGSTTSSSGSDADEEDETEEGDEGEEEDASASHGEGFDEGFEDPSELLPPSDTSGLPPPDLMDLDTSQPPLPPPPATDLARGSGGGAAAKPRRGSVVGGMEAAGRGPSHGPTGSGCVGPAPTSSAPTRPAAASTAVVQQQDQQQQRGKRASSGGGGAAAASASAAPSPSSVLPALQPQPRGGAAPGAAVGDSAAASPLSRVAGVAAATLNSPGEEAAAAEALNAGEEPADLSQGTEGDSHLASEGGDGKVDGHAAEEEQEDEDEDMDEDSEGDEDGEQQAGAAVAAGHVAAKRRRVGDGHVGAEPAAHALRNGKRIGRNALGKAGGPARATRSHDLGKRRSAAVPAPAAAGVMSNGGGKLALHASGGSAGAGRRR